MALEAIQAQAGHRSIESTRIYLHLANDWLAGEYRRAVEAIDAQAVAGAVMPAACRTRCRRRRGRRTLSRRNARRGTPNGPIHHAGRPHLQRQDRPRRRLGRADPRGQIDAINKARSFASWLMVTGQITVDAELLGRVDLRLGIAGEHFWPDDYRWFIEICCRLGTSNDDLASAVEHAGQDHRDHRCAAASRDRRPFPAPHAPR